MGQCLQCQSHRVVAGSTVSYRDGEVAHFQPGNLRFWTFTVWPGPQMSPKALACLDCGLVWSRVQPAKLVRFVRRHCKLTVDLPPE